MRLGRIALEAIDEPGLGGAEEEPVAPGLLQFNKELPTAVHRLFVQFVPALELDLERELAAHRMKGAALAPDSDVRLGGVPMPEVQYPEVLEYFFDYGLVHQFDPFALRCLQCRQDREDARVVIDVRSPSGAWLNGN